MFEENVEGSPGSPLVFQSNGADPVGPIRSGRTQDIDLLGSLNQPLFAWSGGNGRVTSAILASDLREVSCQLAEPAVVPLAAAATAPTTCTPTAELYALSPFDAMAPQPQFLYRRSKDEPVGADVAGVKLSMDGVEVGWEWDADGRPLPRFQNGDEHKDTVGDAQINTENVVVLFVDYRPSPADARSPEAQTVGSGEAWVYSGGKVVKGIWKRATRLDPFTLEDPDGDADPAHARSDVRRAGRDRARSRPSTAGDDFDEAAVPATAGSERQPVTAATRY